jgi:hypothetical protein
VLALALRRGSNAARIGAWVVSGLGLLEGLGSTVVVLVERRGVNAPARSGPPWWTPTPAGGSA